MTTKLQKSVLITDLDNTLYDWFTIWHSSFNAMLDEVVRITGIERSILISEIRPIHQKYGTAEYAFLLEEIPSLIKLYGSRENINKNLDSAIHAARSQRMTHLRLYKGVYDTLSELKCRRIKVIAYTESKEWYSKNRLKRLGLDYFIDHLYSPADHHIPIKSDERTVIDFDFMKFSHTPADELKPNPKLLLDIIAEIGATPEQCVYIGDSEMKDVDMAVEAGVTAILAKYGSTHFHHRESDYNLLRDVTHWTDEDVQRERDIKETSKHHKPDFEVTSFEQILDFIDFQPEKKNDHRQRNTRSKN